jgi:hypothetical protein
MAILSKKGEIQSTSRMLWISLKISSDEQLYLPESNFIYRRATLFIVYKNL